MMMAGLIRPTSGTITVEGMPAAEVALLRRGTVGLITADPGLYPLLSGRENLVFFGQLYGWTAKEVLDRAQPLLAQLDLTAQLDRLVGEWSSGMRQKLSLTRALLMRPKLLLLDEPTANLDPLAAHAIHDVVRQQADAGVAVVLCTHDLVAAEALCETVVVVNRRLMGVEHFEGPRRAPPVGRLFSLYQGST